MYRANGTYNNNKQGVTLTGRNTTGPPCSRVATIRLEAEWRHRLACAAKAACRPAVECHTSRQTTTTTDASDENNTGRLGGPVITHYGISAFHFYRWNQFKIIPLASTLRTRNLTKFSAMSDAGWQLDNTADNASGHHSVAGSQSPLFTESRTPGLVECRK